MLLAFPHKTHKAPEEINGKKVAFVKPNPKIADGATEPSYQVVFEDLTYTDLPLSKFIKIKKETA